MLLSGRTARPPAPLIWRYSAALDNSITAKKLEETWTANPTMLNKCSEDYADNPASGLSEINCELHHA